METKRSFRPLRALIGIGMILAGAGLIYWELFVHIGRIRLVGLAAALVIGIVGGVLVLIRSLAEVCAKCGTEIDGLELAFPPELLPAVQAYAKEGGDTSALVASRCLQAEDRERAILRLEGCATCNQFRSVMGYRASWNDGGYFQTSQATRNRPARADENGTLVKLRESRIQAG